MRRCYSFHLHYRNVLKCILQAAWSKAKCLSNPGESQPSDSGGKEGGGRRAAASRRVHLCRSNANKDKLRRFHDAAKLKGKPDREQMREKHPGEDKRETSVKTVQSHFYSFFLIFLEIQVTAVSAATDLSRVNTRKKLNNNAAAADFSENMSREITLSREAESTQRLQPQQSGADRPAWLSAFPGTKLKQLRKCGAGWRTFGERWRRLGSALLVSPE